jgi:hypothetical protein
MNTKPEKISPQRQISGEKLAFLITEAGFLVALAVWGGPAWVVVILPAIFVEIYSGSQLHSLGMLMPAAIWLGLCTLTGNRELFFPYAMYVMAFMVSRLWERCRGAAIIGGLFCGGLFLFIRWLQNATMSVLLVEGVVAAGIIFVLGAFCWQGLNRGWMRMIGLLGASLLAYAGLAL